MNCPTKQELADLFHGQLTGDRAGEIYAHIAICDSCCHAYTALAEANIEPVPRDLSYDIMKQISKGPITRKKLLAIYAVAAACVMLLVCSGWSDKLMSIPDKIHMQNTHWAQKLNQIKLYQNWEENHYGIQN